MQKSDAFMGVPRVVRWLEHAASHAWSIAHGSAPDGGEWTYDLAWTVLGPAVSGLLSVASEDGDDVARSAADRLCEVLGAFEALGADEGRALADRVARDLYTRGAIGLPA